ncbi:MAG TPA: hypothetical protein VFB88_03980 [Xanthobacteraceae bacterium]|nr:hypothetical protein [Xanthobacteraceae bacterium]
MKLGMTIAALTVTGAVFVPAPTLAQADRPTSSGSAPQSSSEPSPVQRGPSDPGVSFTFHQTGGAGGGGVQEIVPLAPRSENMANNPGVDSATSSPSVERPAGQ